MTLAQKGVLTPTRRAILARILVFICTLFAANLFLENKIYSIVFPQLFQLTIAIRNDIIWKRGNFNCDPHLSGKDLKKILGRSARWCMLLIDRLFLCLPYALYHAAQQSAQYLNWKKKCLTWHDMGLGKRIRCIRTGVTCFCCHMSHLPCLCVNNNTNL